MARSRRLRWQKTASEAAKLELRYEQADASPPSSPCARGGDVREASLTLDDVRVSTQFVWRDVCNGPLAGSDWYDDVERVNPSNRPSPSASRAQVTARRLGAGAPLKARNGNAPQQSYVVSSDSSEASKAESLGKGEGNDERKGRRGPLRLYDKLRKTLERLKGRQRSANEENVAPRSDAVRVAAEAERAPPPPQDEVDADANEYSDTFESDESDASDSEGSAEGIKECPEEEKPSTADSDICCYDSDTAQGGVREGPSPWKRGPVDASAGPPPGAHAACASDESPGVRDSLSSWLSPQTVFLNVTPEVPLRTDESDKESHESSGDAAPLSDDESFALVDGQPQTTAADEQPEVPGTTPHTPKGEELIVRILSTWGDSDHVGLNGIEIFDSEGIIVRVRDPATQVALTSVAAQSKEKGEGKEMAVECTSIANLFDGRYTTCDENHLWSAEVASGSQLCLAIKLNEAVSIGMVRLWNYNKSRIHSFCGVRDVEMVLDGIRIFKGEIRKSPGDAKTLSDLAENVFFTADEAVLGRIEAHDAKQHAALLLASTHEMEDHEMRRSTLPPPPIEMVESEDDSSLHSVADEAAAFPHASGEAPRPACAVLEAESLKLEILSTWGDDYYVGLTGLEVLDERGDPIAIDLANLGAEPADLNVLPGSFADDRTIDKCVNGTNVTTDDVNMWLAPFEWLDTHDTISIGLGSRRKISALRIWNYNKSLEDTRRGVKTLNVYADGKLISHPSGVLVPKAPGVSSLDFAYTIKLEAPVPTFSKSKEGEQAPAPSPWVSALPHGAADVAASSLERTPLCVMVDQGWEVPTLPCGFVLKIAIYSTWGDPHYVGLSGLEIVDAVSGPIAIGPTQIAAAPRSVADLEGMEKDVRVPARLVDGHNDADEVSHSWLAPLSQDAPNMLYVAFQTPVMLAAVRLWNYARTPARGAREVRILLDDCIIYEGVLGKYEGSKVLGGGSAHQAILFTNDPGVVGAEHAHIPVLLPPKDQEDGVMFTNDRKVVRGKILREEPIGFGPRPSTSVIR